MIYMDADIMCQGTLQPLLNIQFKDDEIAAVVPERDRNWWQKS